MRKLLVLLAVALSLAGQQAAPPSIPTTVTVKTELGPFEFDGIRLYSPVDTKPCLFVSDVSNATPIRWDDVLFQVRVIGITLDKQPIAFDIPVGFEHMSVGLNFRVVTECPPEAAYITRRSIEITFRHGTPNEADLAAHRKTLAAAATAATARAAERKREAAEITARNKFLATLPLVNSGTPAVFLGADKKCAGQFQDAVAMEGLEKRKRIAELVSFQCGTLVDNLVHVTLGAKEGAFQIATIAEGKHQGKSGWVPVAWVK